MALVSLSRHHTTPSPLLLIYIVYKTYQQEYLDQSAGVLLIMRNPYDAFKAEFNRKQTERAVVNGVRGRSHVGHADPAGLDS